MIRDLIAQAGSAVVMVVCPDIDSKGSGFFVNSDGYVVTNSHVVADVTFQQGVLTVSYSTQITVFVGGSYYRALLVTDPTAVQPIVYDYAILKVDGLSATPYLEVGDHTMVQSGDEVVCLGFPLDFETLIATKGIVSAVLRRPSHWNSLYRTWTVVTDAVIRFGNSGGPMLHLDSGKAVGINTLHHELRDVLRQRLETWLLHPGAGDFALVRDLIHYTLKYTYVGLNHAVSVEYVRGDPAWPTPGGGP